ncbi:aminoacyl-tRNA hydrolase [Candidatus Gracilibacteria bacterium]|nr:aminoacyl-tRNA hydrolase [Candidatus Gracilibacteria bacterium]
MRLIIGLGNPGDKYKNTRHNVGFLFLDWLKKDMNISNNFEFEQKFNAEIFGLDILGEKYLFIKPQTFMNLSGDSVLKLMSFYNIKKEDIIVVFDDISMDFGKIRYREKGSAGGQNGIKDIINKIGDDFKRIKIGIGYDTRWDLSDWVLSKFNEEEFEKLSKDIFKEVNNLLKTNFIK